MNRLTLEEVTLILQLIEKQYGYGYSRDKVIGKLQAKLSVMLEVLSKSDAGK